MSEEVEDEVLSQEVDSSAPATQKPRRRKPPKRQVRVLVPFGADVRDIFRYVTEDSEGGSGARAKISDDAVRVMNEIIERIGDDCVERAEQMCDPSRETLYCSDLANAIRTVYLFSEQQEEMAKVVMDAREAVLTHTK